MIANGPIRHGGAWDEMRGPLAHAPPSPAEAGHEDDEARVRKGATHIAIFSGRER